MMEQFLWTINLGFEEAPCEGSERNEKYIVENWKKGVPCYIEAEKNLNNTCLQ